MARDPSRWPVERCPDFACLRWSGPVNSGGYSVVWSGRRAELAHVIAYRDSGRVIGPGQVVDHVCRRRNCVEPRHLQAVTQTVNELRKSLRYRMRLELCPMGHKLASCIYTPEGGRLCRICIAILLREDAAGGPR